MFTVLIAEKEHIDAMQQGNRLFFEPFLKNKDLACCYWNPAGQCLDDAVPGLRDAVGRRKDWRAVIIHSGTEESFKKQNPFDLVDHSELDVLDIPSQQPESDETLESWEADWKSYFDSLTRAKEAICRSAMEFPLQKLATWLCFQPEEYLLGDVQEKQNVFDWAMERVGRNDAKPSVRLEILERAQYRCELRMKETIRREFVGKGVLNISYPSEIHCISTRTAESSFFNPDAYWNVRQDVDYSAFADRNMYFDKMRFMVFDLLPKTHRNFRTDYIRFLASILIFASNQAPSSAMQARRLYQLEVDADEAPLCTLVTSYDRKLAATFAVIENEMEKIRSEIPSELTDKDADALFCAAMEVPVQLDDSCDPEKVVADNDYGLFFDLPENEFHRWNRDYHISENALTYILKQHSRSVRKGIAQMHLRSEMSDVNVCRLTPLQVDDIRDYTDAAEDKMVSAIPPDIKDMSRYTKRMAEASKRVKRTIRSRMTRKTALSLCALCLGLYLLCFLPFLFTNDGTTRSMATAVILMVCMLGILACVMVITLLILRSKLRKEVEDYNSTAQEIMDEVLSSMKRVSKYLSAACSVRRGHAVQNYVQKNLDVYTKSLRIRKKHLEDIRKRRAYLGEEYGDYLGDRTFCDEAMSHPYDYDFDQRTEFEYPAPFLSGDFRQIEFISNGNLITVPSSYITRILVRMEGLYEK